MKITVSHELAGLTIKQYLNAKRLSSRMITRLKANPAGILVNGEKKTVRHLLSEGEMLELDLKDSIRASNISPSFEPLEILFEDEWYLAINKPPALPIHPSRGHIDDTLASRVMGHFCDRNFVFRVLTRLDRDTSGAVIIAKDAVSAQRFSKLLEEKKVKKEYLAICRGLFEKDEGKIELNIRRPDPKSIVREAVESTEHSSESSPFGTYAISEYKVIKRCDSATLVRFFPVTGRTHQLRVHSLAIGHPILSDTLYSTECPYIKRQALHAHKISFIHPFTSENITVVAPVPSDMESCEKELFSDEKIIENKVNSF